MLRRLIPPAGPNRFAKKVIAAMRAAGCTDPIEYDPQEFCLRIARDKGATFWLSNAYGEYCHARLFVRRRLLTHFAQLFAVPTPDVPDTFEEAAPHLLPRVATRTYLSTVPRLIGLTPEDSPALPHILLTEQLGVAVAHDFEKAIALITREQLEKWGVSVQEALAAARDNLWRISNESFREVVPGLYLSPWQDNHDASRLYLHDLIWQLEVTGDHVAMVPHRDVLLVTGSGNAAGLKAMADLASSLLGDTRCISGIPVRLEGTTWKTFVPDGDGPAAEALRSLRTRSLAREYAKQEELLERQRPMEATVGRCVQFADRHGEASWVVCVWTPSARILLPEADLVSLDDSAGAGRPLLVRWADCRRLVGHRMHPQGLWPERYLVEEFPSAEELAALREVALRR